MLTGLELMFMGVTGSNSGLFSIPGFLVSPNSNMLDPKAVAGEAENNKKSLTNNGKTKKQSPNERKGGSLRKNAN